MSDTGRDAAPRDPGSAEAKLPPSQRETLRPIYIRIDPEQLVTLKYIIESYDFLGILRTLNRDSGEIVVLAVDDTVDELNALLASIQPEIGFAVIPPPQSVCEDWLLAETYPERHGVEAPPSKL